MMSKIMPFLNQTKILNGVEENTPIFKIKDRLCKDQRVDLLDLNMHLNQSLIEVQ